MPKKKKVVQRKKPDIIQKGEVRWRRDAITHRLICIPPGTVIPEGSKTYE